MLDPQSSTLSPFRSHFVKRLCHVDLDEPPVAGIHRLHTSSVHPDRQTPEQLVEIPFQDALELVGGLTVLVVGEKFGFFLGHFLGFLVKLCLFIIASLFVMGRAGEGWAVVERGGVARCQPVEGSLFFRLRQMPSLSCFSNKEKYHPNFLTTAFLMSGDGASKALDNRISGTELLYNRRSQIGRT